MLAAQVVYAVAFDELISLKRGQGTRLQKAAPDVLAGSCSEGLSTPAFVQSCGHAQSNASMLQVLQRAPASFISLAANWLISFEFSKSLLPAKLEPSVVLFPCNTFTISCDLIFFALCYHAHGQQKGMQAI